MNRVSTNLGMSDSMFQMKDRDLNIARARNQISTGIKHQQLREDPNAIAAGTRFKAQEERLNQYIENIEQHLTGRYAQAEAHTMDTFDALNRLKEIAVQGANGTYDDRDLKIMASEVDVLLEHMLEEVGNAQLEDGSYLFAGADNMSQPFAKVIGRVEGGDRPMITEVHYKGSAFTNKMAVSEGVTVDAQFAGNRVFWVHNQEVIGDRPVDNYIVPENSTIVIDTYEIDLVAGDTIQDVLDKINQSPISVKASLDPVTNRLTFNSTTPHQIIFDEAEEETVLKDLGIIANNSAPPPNNMNPNVISSGGSIFDQIIELRNALYKGDYETIGGSALGGIDAAIETVTITATDIGTRGERIGATGDRHQRQLVSATTNRSNYLDADVAAAATRLAELDLARQATYQITNKVLQKTLLDFLR